MANYDVFGIGNALMDIQAFIPDKILKKLKIPKGIMHLIDEKKSKEILNEISSYKTVSVPGGSCSNTISCIAMLGGKSAFIGVVVDDFYGRLYETKLVSRGVKSLIKKKSNGLTGTSIILTTEDAERTMNTYLGVCRDLVKEDIDIEFISQSKILHCTGYEWDMPLQKEALEYAVKNARELDLKISFDIADPFCIARNVVDFKRIISEGIDIIFGNLEEAKILTGMDDPVLAGKEIRKMGAKVVLIKVGCKGSYLLYDDKAEHINIYEADNVLDSTGCGDIFAGGFLYGYSRGFDIVKCAKIASYTASRIVSVPGVQLELLDFNNMKTFIESNI